MSFDVHTAVCLKLSDDGQAQMINSTRKEKPRRTERSNVPFCESVFITRDLVQGPPSPSREHLFGSGWPEHFWGHITISESGVECPRPEFRVGNDVGFVERKPLTKRARRRVIPGIGGISACFTARQLS